MPTAADFTITPRRIIGTGEVADLILMIPLLHSWGIPRACKIAQEPGEPSCEAPMQRIVIVDHTDPPDVFEGDSWRNGLGFCEPHFQILRSS